MDEPDNNLVLPAEYVHIPLRAVNMATRRKLANFLNLEGSLVVVNVDGEEFDVVNDVTGLAELAGFQYNEIMNMKRQKNPTTEFLDQWTGIGGNVGKLWRLLYLMERFDVLTDCRQNILKDCTRYENYEDFENEANNFHIEQDPTVSTSEMRVDETKNATIDDVLTGNQKTKYDAFISYASDDKDDLVFVKQMIEVLEGRGLKLFVPGRDDIPGGAEHVISAYLIEKRCKRVAILMSKSFLRSPACDFQVKFAHALAPGARSKRLIPIIREKNTQLPRILRFLAVCDFSKSDMTEWVWDRLYTAMLAPTGPITYFDDDDAPDLGLIYPTQPRLDILQSSSPQQSREDLLQARSMTYQPNQVREISEHTWSDADRMDDKSLPPSIQSLPPSIQSQPPSTIPPSKKPKKPKSSLIPSIFKSNKSNKKAD